ncbi:MAG: HEAT repeat domain-containing protein [Bradymonadaceae bacterium]|nr:HEAT repeat domain-containing protein [Lujinxingiaceae bacterium]
MFSRIAWMKVLVGSALSLFLAHSALAQKHDVVTRPSAPLKPDAEASHERAKLLLSGYHGLVSQAELESAVPNAREVMFDIARDKASAELHRQRAVAALGFWPDATVHALFRALLSASDSSEGLRHQLIGHLARVFGDAALADIAPYLADDDVQLRLTAISALGMLGTDEALLLLAKAGKSESNPVVLERIAQAGRHVR